MYLGNIETQAAEERYQDLLKEADVERLTHLKPRPVHPNERTLYRLGQQLVVWGYRLQAHSSLKK